MKLVQADVNHFFDVSISDLIAPMAKEMGGSNALSCKK